MLRNATPLRKSIPWPPNSSDEHVSFTAPATRNASLQILFKCPTSAIVFGNATKPWRFAPWCTIPCGCHAKRHLNVQKCSNGVHFFNISTSQSGLRPSVFYTFDFGMCLAPQPRALFRHLNFQKWSETVSFLHFWFRNVLRATTACNCSSLISPDGSAPAALASLLFDPRESNHWKNTVFREYILPFCARASSFFWLFLFSDLLSSSLLFSNSSHLCVSICPYCRKFDFEIDVFYQVL